MKFNLIGNCAARRSELPGAAADSMLRSESRTGFLTRLNLCCYFLTFIYGGLSSLTAQDLNLHSNHRPVPLWVFSTPTSGQSKSLGNPGDLGEFQNKVKARYKAARNGSISILIPSTCKAGDVILAKVIIQRAPEGSDGLGSTAISNNDRGPASLKVDDEMQVKLTVQEDGALQIQADNAQPQPTIRRILPGGHAEWMWHIKVLRPGEQHLIVTSDVIYRRNFLSYEPPIVSFTASTVSFPLQVQP